MTLEQTIKDIKSVKIQGASNVARAAMRAWAETLNKSKPRDAKKFLREANETAGKLGRARPNEPMAINVLAILKQSLEAVVKDKNFSELNRENKILTLKKTALSDTGDLDQLLHANGEKIAGFGAGLINNKDNVFVHCHSRTVENILLEAKRKNKKFHVYNDETRPLFQGRITAEELAEAGIKNTMVVDSAAAFIVSNFSGDEIDIKKVFIGCDVILPDGSAFNKIGSFGIALAAYTSKIPLYIATSTLKFTRNKNMKIEIRDAAEVWPGKPKSLEIINYSFGHIPAKFITGYITEFGVVKPREISALFEKYYKV